MPERLPLVVVLWGLTKEAGWQVLWLIRVMLVASLWLLGVPWLTAQSLHYYGLVSQIAAGSPAWYPFMLDCVIGLMVTGSTFVLFLALMLLRDLLQAEREQEQARHELQWRDEAPSAAADLDDDNNDNDDEDGISPAEGWHVGVPPREYRAWLRRKQLQRERQALEDGRRAREEEDARRTSVFSNPDEGEETQSLRSMGSASTTTMRLRRTSAVTAATTGSPASNNRIRPIVQASESIRCRQCNSRFCVSREHLLLTRTAGQTAHLPHTPTPTPTLTLSPPPAMNREAQPLIVGDDDEEHPALFAIGLNVNPDPEQADLTLSRFLGFASPASPLLTLQSLMLLLLANWLILHTLIIIPMLLGTLPLREWILSLVARQCPARMLPLLQAVQEWSIPHGAILQGYGTIVVLGCIVVRWMPICLWLTRWLRFAGAMAKVALFFVGHELILAPFLTGYVAVRGLELELVNRLVLAQIWAIGLALLMLVGRGLGSLRSELRPGLLWWLRHPHDPASHPLRLAVISSTATLLRRLLTSLAVQGLIMGTFMATGKLVFALTGGSGLRMITRLLSEEDGPPLPVGVLCIVVMSRLSAFFARFICGEIEVGFLWGLRRLAASLRLTSFLFGGRWPEEEVFPRCGQWQWSPSEDRRYEAGEWKLVASTPVEPLDVVRQRSRLPGFTPTFRPHHHGFKVAACFVYALGGALVCHWLGWCLPIWIGRRVLGGKEEVGEDLMALLIGLVCVSSLLRSASFIGSLPGSRLVWILLRGPLSLLQAVFFAAFPLVVWPCLTGLYSYSLVSPLLSRWDQTPIITPLSAWAIGLPIVRLAWGWRQLWVRPQRNQLIDELWASFPWRMPFWAPLRHLLWPMTARLAGLLLVPPLAAILVSPLLGLNPGEMLLLQRCSHSLVLLLPITGLTVSILMHLHKTLVNRIREDTYLIGRRLVNLGEGHGGNNIPLRRPAVNTALEKAR